jgi:hypothetical protein
MELGVLFIGHTKTTAGLTGGYFHATLETENSYRFYANLKERCRNIALLQKERRLPNDQKR